LIATEQKIVPVILSGGGGSRLWPASRHDRPKQFLPLINGKTTFANALARIKEDQLFAPPLIVTARNLAFLAVEELRAAGLRGQIVLEPVRRDSAPAIAIAALLLRRQVPGTLLLVLAADHLIRDVEAFQGTVRNAAEAARSGHIVTFGIKPDKPSQDYGYIEPGPAVDAYTKKVVRFVEKPDAERATTLIEQGCLWNSGNFLLRSDIFLSELARFEPGILAAATAAFDASATDQQDGVAFCTIAEAPFAAAPARSIDYAIMERTSKAAVIPANYVWSDLGSFDSLWSNHSKDPAGNIIAGDTMLQHVNGSYVSSEGLLTVVMGLNDIAVVATPDAVLVAPRTIGAELKPVVAALEASPQWRELVQHGRVCRAAWGSATTLLKREGLRLSMLRLDAGASISFEPVVPAMIQVFVIQGTGTIESGGRVENLRRGTTTLIPAGELSGVNNTGVSPLELLKLELSAE
jgi:mannose-1-phosphate guanylyltransferase/mannose-6-phosphate isomerase